MRSYLSAVAALALGALISYGAAAQTWAVPESSAPWLPAADACGDIGANPNPATYWIPCTNRVPDPNAPFSFLAGYLLVGRMDAWPGAPDFFVSVEDRHWGQTGPLDADGTPKVFARSLVLADLGDTPDLVLRRANAVEGWARYNGTPSVVNDGEGLGTLYWQTWGANCAGYGWRSCTGHSRVAGINAVAVGAQTDTSRAGKLCFYTSSPNTKDSGTQRMCLTENGLLAMAAGGDAANPIVQFPGHPGISADSFGVKFSIYGPSSRQFGGAFTWPDSSGDTSIVLVIRKPNNVFETKAVRYGAPDSCGTGNRCLYVAN